MPEGGLGAQVGPLKAWQWVAIIGGALLVYYIWKQHQANAQAAADAAAAAQQSTAGPTDTQEDAAYDALSQSLNALSHEEANTQKQVSQDNPQIQKLEREAQQDAKEDKGKKSTPPREAHKDVGAVTTPHRAGGPRPQPRPGSTEQQRSGVMLPPSRQNAHAPTQEANGRHAGSAQPMPAKVRP